MDDVCMMLVVTESKYQRLKVVSIVCYIHDCGCDRLM